MIYHNKTGKLDNTKAMPDDDMIVALSTGSHAGLVPPNEQKTMPTDYQRKT